LRSAEIEGEAGGSLRPGASADPRAGLEDNHPLAGIVQPARRGDAGSARSNNNDVV
jgi:hypothetical protein